MKKLSKPEENVEEVFINCISAVTDTELQHRLKSCRDLLNDAEKKYEKCVEKQELHTIKRIKNSRTDKLTRVIDGKVTSEEMKNVYTNYFVPEGSPGRSIYNKLLLAPSNGICPLCSQRIVSTLDHHLPKSDYPIYSVTPINLIPSCTDCNKVKLSKYPEKSEEETLHPYFDDVEDDVWLNARVLKTSPAVIEYYVDPPEVWPKLIGDRVRFHFETFKLASLYSVQAAVELLNIGHTLLKIFMIQGKAGVINHLSDCATSRYQINKNSWQTAMYSAISKDDWFCEGGFKY